MHAEIFRGKQAVHAHAGGILRRQFIEIRLDLVQQLLRREIRIDKITKIQQLGIPPVSAVPALQRLYLIVSARKHRRRDIQILNVVNLVPQFAVQTLCFDLGIVEHCDDFQDLLVILVVADRIAIRFQKRHVMRFGKVLRKLINIDGFIVSRNFFELELLPRNKFQNIVRIGQFDARSVHPALVFIHQRERVARIVHQHTDNPVLHDQIGFEKQRVVRAKIVFGEIKRIDIVRLIVDGIVHEHDRRFQRESLNEIHQLPALVSHNDDDSVEPIRFKLV